MMELDVQAVMARGGHPGGSASTLRLLRWLRPARQSRDLVMSSKGHDAAAFLIDAVERGALDPSWLERYRAGNGYPGHPERGVTPGAIVSTGSLGMGLSKAVGLAYGWPDRRVICVVGDGESQEGQVWEALQMAARLGLSNLVVLFDHNGAQSDNRPLPQPNVLHPDGIFKAAGWPVQILDWDRPPHLAQVPGLPLCVLAHGTKALPHATSTPGPLVQAYGKALRVALEADPSLVVLEADVALDHGLTGLAEAFPGRVLTCGVAEQHMVSMAVGLAAAGKRPILHAFERFFYRAAEQILDATQEPGLTLHYVAGLAGVLPQGPGRSHELPRKPREALWHPEYIIWTVNTPRAVEEVVPMMLRQNHQTVLRLLAQPALGDV
jgi:transketolase N-terminal domain/subunit